MTGVLCLLVFGYQVVLIAHVIFSYVPTPPEPVRPIMDVTRRLVDPLLVPLRRVLPPLPLGGIRLDLSIMVLFFGTYLLSAALCG